MDADLREIQNSRLVEALRTQLAVGPELQLVVGLNYIS